MLTAIMLSITCFIVIPSILVLCVVMLNVMMLVLVILNAIVRVVVFLPVNYEFTNKLERLSLASISSLI
jgi:hypothetical protein